VYVHSMLLLFATVTVLAGAGALLTLVLTIRRFRSKKPSWVNPQDIVSPGDESVRSELDVVVRRHGPKPY
jgi:hypothetical protein